MRGMAPFISIIGKNWEMLLKKSHAAYNPLLLFIKIISNYFRYLPNIVMNKRIE